MNYFLFGKRPKRTPRLPVETRFWVKTIKTIPFLLFVLTTAAQANVAAQMVTITLEDAKIERFFDEISKQTNYRFVYSDDVARRTAPVTIRVNNRDAEKVLRDVLANRRLRYKVIAGTVSVDLIPESPERPAPS